MNQLERSLSRKVGWFRIVRSTVDLAAGENSRSCLAIAIGVVIACALGLSATTCKRAPKGSSALNGESATIPQEPTKINGEETFEHWKTKAGETREKLRRKISELDESLQRHPDDVKSRLTRGRVKRTLRQYVRADERAKLDKEAIEDFEVANTKSLPPGSVIALVEAGRVHVARYEFDKADQYFRRAAAIDEGNVEIVAEIAKMEGLKSGDWHDTVQIVEALLQDPAGNRSPGVWHALGMAYFELGRLPEAERAFLRKLELAPDEIRTWSNIGLVQAAQGRTEDAINAHERVRAADPTDIHFAVNISNTLTASNDPSNVQEAIRILKDALAAGPEVAAAWNNLGNAYSKLKEYEEALRSYANAIKLFPGYAAAHDNMGLAYQELGKWPEAIASHRQATSLDPNTSGFLYHLGNACARGRYFSEAAQSFERYMVLSPEDSRGWNNYGNVLIELGRLDEATTAYQKALRLSPQHASAFANLAYVANKRGAHEEAADFAEKALAIDPLQTDAMDHLVNASAYLNNIDAAIRILRQSRDRAPQHPYSSFAVASVQFHRGDLSSAEQECDAAINRDSEFGPAYNLRGLIRLMRGKSVSAVDDLTRAIEIRPRDAYCRLFLWMIQGRETQSPLSRAAIDEITTAHEESSWENRLLRLVKGELDPDALLKDATTDEQLCEAYFYLGEVLRVQRKDSEARLCFENAIKTGVKHFLEYRLARWELVGE